MPSTARFWILLLAVFLAASIWPSFSLSAPAVLAGERQSDTVKVKLKCDLDVTSCLKGKERCCHQLQTVDADCFCNIAKKVAVDVSVDVGVELLKKLCPRLVDVQVRVHCPGHSSDHPRKVGAQGTG